MLQFIYYAEVGISKDKIISIHLMLQFISEQAQHWKDVHTFQYISCCSLSWFTEVYKKDATISIHLMLQFINHLSTRRLFSFEFQYISCCSLSTQELGAMYKLENFNTSHVVVYPEPLLKAFLANEFQYISCCSLSRIDG